MFTSGGNGVMDAAAKAGLLSRVTNILIPYGISMRCKMQLAVMDILHE